MEVKRGQNIFDVALQNYGSLNFAVKMCVENNLALDESPEVGKEIVVEEGFGDLVISNWTKENDFTFNNVAVDNSAGLLVAEDTALELADNEVAIYK